MVFDGNNSDCVSNTMECDVVIVGAGTIGLYMAARLLKDSPNRNICIIESGNKKPRIDSNYINSESVGENHSGTLNGRYSGLGGTSSIWGGQLAEFEKADFDRPDSEWPVSYDEIKYFYKEVYSFLGLKHFLPIEYFDKIFNNGSSINNKLESYYTVRIKSKDTDFSNYFNKEIRTDTLAIIINTTAYNINFNDNIANELICRSTQGRKISVKANYFIFASGTLGINQFFLSTRAIYDVPWKLNNYIGKYFQDHLGGEVGRLKLHDAGKFRKSFERRIINGIKIQRKMKFRNKYRVDMHNGVVLSFKYHSKNQKYIESVKLSIKELRNSNKMQNVLMFLKDLYRIRGYLFSFLIKLIFKQQIHEAFDDGIEVFVQSEQVPIPESSIIISKEEMLKSGLFKIHIDWKWSGKEIEGIHDAIIELKRYLKKQNIADIVMDFGIKKRDQSVLKNFRDMNHQCGGMRMSKSNEKGVVDSDCKVWGTDNVWVAGAAVFPSSSHANSTLTALALAERIVQKSL